MLILSKSVGMPSKMPRTRYCEYSEFHQMLIGLSENKIVRIFHSTKWRSKGDVHDKTFRSFTIRLDATILSIGRHDHTHMYIEYKLPSMARI